MAKALKLRFVAGKYEGGEFRLPAEGEVIIGRGAELPVVLAEDMVSRKHARLTIQGERISVYISPYERVRFAVDDRKAELDRILALNGQSVYQFARDHKEWAGVMALAGDHHPRRGRLLLDHAGGPDHGGSAGPSRQYRGAGRGGRRPGRGPRGQLHHRPRPALGGYPGVAGLRPQIGRAHV
jgi:hypothetical protein